MKVLTDENGYVYTYVTLGCDDWPEVEGPEDFDEEQFALEYRAYKVVNGKLVKDSDKLLNVLDEHKINELRYQRQSECFPIINRGTLWYEQLTKIQIEELNSWYKAWLDVTETGIIPDKPIWLE